jgi:cyclopropane fatty-acyl-phospholipid synthase-like methyltransferase
MTAIDPATARHAMAAMWPSDIDVHRVDTEAFEEKYRADGDPWRFATSPYEQRRYDLIMAMLPRERYRRCFEPGASIGELTRRLATRCDEVVAVEASATAVQQAEQLIGTEPGVTIVQATVPEWWPRGSFDLVMMSEFGYYFDRDVLSVLIDRAADLLTVEGTFVAAHWRGQSVDHLLHGDEVHEVTRDVLRSRLGRPSCVYTEAAVRIDMWGAA